MKKIYTILLSLAVSGSLFAQSQRLVIFEEFTSEDCPPCAAINPSLNAMLNQLGNDVVSIKYQNNIPSPGPLFGHNSAEVLSRMTYYGNNYSPNGILDGNVFNDNAGALTSVDVTNRSAVTSPFTINISHVINGTNVDVTATVKATGNVSTTNLFARFAIVERNIYFTTAPGTNGEKHFEGVMKKMLPNATGTALPAVMNAGDSVNYTFSWPMANVYNVDQIAVVGFVQQDGVKEIIQGGYSRTLINNDAGITGLNSSFLNCNPNVTPSVTVFNYGIAPLTSLDILYKVDNGSFSTFSWTGSIASGSSAVVTLPTITFTSGPHTLTVATSNPNATTDQDPNNDQTVSSILITSAAIAAPITQNFSASAYPPAGWARYSVDATNSWSRSTATASPTTPNTGSSKIDFYNSNPGQIDELYLPAFDLSTATSATLTFQVAKVRYSAAYNDRLDIIATSDCGATYTTVYSKSDATGLTTNLTPATTAWTPTAANWRLETVDMNAFVGQPSVVAAFKAISGYGNNGYIDDVNLTSTVGIGENAIEQSINVFPMPSTGNVSITVDKIQASNFTVIITDVAGKLISREENVQNNGILNIDLSTQENGIYFVTLENQGQRIIKKVVLNK
jgi:thiol-disulfide isomerase/thioredoxin